MLKEVRGLYEDVHKLHQGVLAYHGKAEESIERMSAMQRIIKKFTDAQFGHYMTWTGRMQGLTNLVLLWVFLLALAGGITGGFLSLMMFRLAGGAN